MAAREARCPRQKGQGRTDFVFYIMMRKEIQVSVSVGWLPMHKCLKGLSPSYLLDKFSTRATIHERQTRNRDSLNIPPSRINAGQRPFYYRGVKVWNDLSKELREITNTKVFKRRLINELICDMN